jgi:polygalacturonase
MTGPETARFPRPGAARVPRGRRTAGRRIGALLLCLAAAVSCRSRLTSGPPENGWVRVPRILESIRPPSFPRRNFDVTAFGAVGDGKTPSGSAVRRAIEACAAAGGGRVTVPAGVFLTGAVRLESRVELRLEKGAVLRFSRDPREYLPAVFTRFEGMECMNYSPFVYAEGREDVAVTGEGVLDGQADSTSWWPWCGGSDHGWRPGGPSQNADRNALMDMCERNVPVAERVFGEGHYLRPNFIQFVRCRNVLIEGVTVERSPMWCIHPVLCENVTVRNVRIQSHGPNNDGCDPESCRNVLIRGCFFDTGDDCIAIKSGRNADGRRVNRPSENIVVMDCVMRDGHGGVVIGSEISGSCRNVFVENCVMDSPNLERALRIKTNSIRGGVVENVYMRDVTVGEVRDAVVWVYFHYEEGDAGPHTPVVRNIDVRRVKSRKSTFALLLDGYERSPIMNVRIQDCEFDGVLKGNILEHVTGLTLKGVTINGKPQ